MIRVLLVDDHAVVRAGFRLLLESKGVEVVAEADCAEAACQLYLKVAPDVVVMDLSLPGIGGLDGIRRLLARDSGARILVYSIHEESVYVRHALAAGACGYLSKRSAPEILGAALAAVMAGESYVEAALAETLGRESSPLESLSPREFEVFHRVAAGQTTSEVSKCLKLSDKTVANYLTSIKTKLGARTLADLARLAFRYHLL